MDLNGQIASCAKELENLAREELEYLNHSALVCNIGASTRIENAVLTDSEIEWIDTTLSTDEKTTAFEQNKEFILNKLSKDKERSIEEVAGCREMLINIYASHNEISPLREFNIREFHQILLKHYPQASRYLGRYKQVTNRVVSRNHDTGEEKVVLEPAAPGAMTEAAMKDLVEWYNRTLIESKLSLLTSIEFVFRFLAIHPFQDGNGRTGRALFILSLLQSPDPYLSKIAPYLPIDKHLEKNRAVYYSVLRQCSDGKFLTDPTMYNYEPLTRFFIKIYRDSINEISLFREKYKKLNELNNTDLKVLEVFKFFPEKRVSISLIVEESKLAYRTVQRSTSKLCTQGFLKKQGQRSATVYQVIF